MKYYFVNQSHEFGDYPLEEASSFSELADAMVKYVELTTSEECDAVVVYEFDTDTMDIKIIICSYEEG